MKLLDPLFGWEAVDGIFSDPVRLQHMLDFEGALARAEARLGVIPQSAATPITDRCRADLFDLESLARAAAQAGNLAIPMVKQLTDLVGQKDKEAARYVHWGATSQDAIDTGLVLQMRDAFDLIVTDLHRLSELLVALADGHRTTSVAARTWMQQAVPTVFGLKAAGWLDAITRHRSRLQEMRERVLVVQFGGAAGSLASLGSRGMEIATGLAEELRLGAPDIPWHAHRDRVAEVATTLALLTGTLGKVARDISLQTQTEIAEVFEPAAPGRGGSSTMPQKRNPVHCAAALAAAYRVPGLAGTMLGAMPQENERGLGGWHAEWETLPELVRLSAGALHHVVEAVQGLQIDVTRMRHNLEATHGLVFAEAVAMSLGKHVGKSEAHRLIEQASRKAASENQHLRDVLSADAEVTSHISTADLEKLFEPLNYRGVADEFIDRVITASKASGERR
jgi:3-carboxy-cis,cis-muconate cycloisomerase